MIKSFVLRSCMYVWRIGGPAGDAVERSGAAGVAPGIYLEVRVRGAIRHLTIQAASVLHPTRVVAPEIERMSCVGCELEIQIVRDRVRSAVRESVTGVMEDLIPTSR